ncbi:MAG: L-rhamnose mutarotase [Kiritimatiellia bacterium]
MIRKAFLMEVKPGRIEAYEKAHNPVWPELEKIMKSHGIHNYSIFHHAATNQLFGYVEIEDEGKLAKMAENPVCKKWWLHMTEYLVSKNPGDKKAREEEMRRVFHMD